MVDEAFILSFFFFFCLHGYFKTHLAGENTLFTHKIDANCFNFVWIYCNVVILLMAALRKIGAGVMISKSKHYRL